MKQTSKRHYDLDWLRVMGMLLIFLFHCARFFNEEDWHVKNNQLDFGMSVFVGVLNQFIMPLFFVLSASAMVYALEKRSNAQFMRERVTRLLVPFGVGIFSHIILQVYIERLTHGDFSGNFWDFIPEYFNGWYAFGGNFAWMGLHLWYLLMLFLFSWMMLGLFRRFRTNENLTSRLADRLARPVGIYLPVALLFISELLVSLSPDTIGRRDFGGWSPLTYLVFFLLGYWITTDGRYRVVVQSLRFYSLVISLMTVLTGYFLLEELGYSGLHPLFLIVRVANAWAWLLTFLGFASRHLSESHPFLRYAGQAVLPFYILHQTVIVMIGYLIRGWAWAVLPKYFFLAVTSFVVILALYELLVRRYKTLRFLFGMKV